MLEKRREARRADKPETVKVDAKKANRKDRAAQRAAQAPLRKAAKAAERELEKRQTECAKLEEAMADPKFFEGRSDKLTDLQIKLADVKAKQEEEAEEASMESEEALEDAG